MWNGTEKLVEIKNIWNIHECMQAFDKSPCRNEDYPMAELLPKLSVVGMFLNTRV
jgi:hypothetical protein